jgi:cellulose synthase/poly-beta-1,6-N-acetylglucosamine synthase-like glycosyltransferase
MSDLPSICIVMPAYNAAHLLPISLKAAIAAAGDNKVVVVDPGSTDNTADVAREMGAEVIRLPKQAGPAHARNVGTKTVDTDIVVYIDSDCVAHPGIIERIQEAFAANSNLVSLTGSYDDTPPERNFASLYMNLRHHFVHQRAKTTGASFWAGLGAVRRDVYERLGGFDADKYPMPMIEDIELGLRLQKEGDTALDPTLHVTHLKKWSVQGVVATDINCRARPWSELIMESGEMPNDLNLHWTQRMAAAIAPFVLLGLVSAPVAALLGQWLLVGALLTPAAISLVMHKDFIAFFAASAGLSFAVRGWLFHQVHLTYSAAVFAMVAGKYRLGFA